MSQDVSFGRPVVDDAECARLACRDGDHRRAAVNPSERAGRVNGAAVLRSAPALRVTLPASLRLRARLMARQVLSPS